MDDETVRGIIYDTAGDLGIGLRSVSRNPLKNTWYIHRHASHGIDYLEFVPDQSVKDVKNQVRALLDPSSVVQEPQDIIEGLRSNDRDVIYGAMQRLQSIGEPAVESLLKILLDENEARRVRRRVADTLTMIGDPRAIPALVQMLNDSDPGTRWSAIRALEKIGDPTALPALQRLAAMDEETFLLFPGKTIDNRSAATDSIDRINDRELNRA